MNVEFFENQSNFREWLEKNSDITDELWVGYFKKHTKIPSITWPQSVDEALCFGWIDGIRKSIDDQRYKIRFTPRRKNSNWSTVNINRVKDLQPLGLMKPSGLKAFENRKANSSELYSFEQEAIELGKSYEDKLRANDKAWAFFQSLAPSYKKSSIWWIISAKQEKTRKRRLNVLIESSLKGEKIPPL